MRESIEHRYAVCGHFSKLLSQTTQKMKKIFIEDIGMETQTLFKKDGSIDINPCSFELGQHIVAGGMGEASQKGRMVTDESGTSHFTPYAKDSGSRYTLLFRTAHGEVKETRDSVIFQLRFPKKLGKALIESLFREETEEQGAFIKTRRTETQW